MTTTLVSSCPFPSPSLFTPTLHEDSASCVCTLSELIAQLSDKNTDEFRFQCLAYTRRGNNPKYYRCPKSSQHFGASHPDLYKHTTQLLSKDLLTPFQYSCFVVRTLFCDTHCKSATFNKYYERIEANWKGDGNEEEQSLLNAIRCAFKLQASSRSALAAPMPGWSSPCSFSIPPTLTFNIPHGMIPRTDSASKIAVNSIPAWFPPIAWNGPSNWNALSKPVSTGGTRLGPQTIPQRRLSKDDAFLDQVAGSVDAAAPPLCNAPTEEHISAPHPTDGVQQVVSPTNIDYKIRDTIQRNVTKTGYVYILKAPKYFQQNSHPPLLKIGLSMNVSSRMNSLRRECGLFDLAQVEDSKDNKPLMLHWRIEELVHAELSQFNQVWPCTKCKDKQHRPVQHHEWFAVTEEVALRTVQRWRKFIEQEPYDENGIIKDCWSQKFRDGSIPTPKPDEKWDDLNDRDERWTKWLEEGVVRT